MRVAGIVLAGGRSSRMGQPKALLQLEGETFLCRVLRTLEGAGIDELVIVTGRHDAEIRAAVSGAPCCTRASLVLNPRHEEGQLSSLLAGLDALGPDHPDAVVVALVDQPLVRAGTVGALVRACVETGAPVVRPTLGGRHGHPVLFVRETFDALRGAPPDAGARWVVRALGARVLDVAVEDPGIFLDVDTPEDYRRLNAR